MDVVVVEVEGRLWCCAFRRGTPFAAEYEALRSCHASYNSELLAQPLADPLLIRIVAAKAAVLGLIKRHTESFWSSA